MQTAARKSRGWRKHVRSLKAQQRREKDKQTQVKQQAATAPAYESFPRVIRSFYGPTCPHCKNRLYQEPIRKQIQTKEGTRVVYQCTYTHCNGLFRP